MTQNMVERVARVFCAGMGSFTEPNSPDAMVRCMDGEMRPRWVFFADHARAAILAMMEPSSSSSQAGQFKPEKHYFNVRRKIYAA